MTKEPTDNSVKDYLQRATNFLEDARLLFEKERLISTVDRIYYAMFWAAQAALIQKGIITKTHSGLISQFSKEFVKTGLMEQKVFQSLQAAFDMRQDSTYEVKFEVTEDEVKELLEEAEEFINSIKGLVAI